MESIRKKRRIAKFLLKNWLSKIDRDEVEQEELIIAWKYPDLIGYQGILAYNELFYKSYNEQVVSNKTVSLKKNIPAKVTGIFSFDQVINLLNEYNSIDKGKISFLIQPALQDILYGKDTYAVRDLAKEMRVSKSTLSRNLRTLRSHLRVVDQPYQKED